MLKLTYLLTYLLTSACFDKYYMPFVKNIGVYVLIDKNVSKY